MSPHYHPVSSYSPKATVGGRAVGDGYGNGDGLKTAKEVF